MVKDKINYRATGKRSALTRQTNQGRANDGGLRLGEMERDGIMGHGMSGFLNDSYMVRGDQYYMAVCNKTGMIAVYNTEKNLFLSPFADGPLIYRETVEGNMILDVFSRFGRSFSIVRIPYALKLLIQELQVMNVQMRIITEDNIDQLQNLSYRSRNIEKLLHMDTSASMEIDIKKLVEDYKTSIDERLKTREERAKALAQMPQREDINPQNINVDQLRMQETPEASLESSPMVPGSPPFAPGSAESPPFAPGSTNSMQEGGSGFANVFADPNLNAVFNRLPGSKQSTILMMPENQRELVIREIMRTMTNTDINNLSSAGPVGQVTNGFKTGLDAYFNALPAKDQLEALQKTYTQKAGQFKRWEDVVDQPAVTIIKPMSPDERLYTNLPMLKPENPDDKKDGDNDDNNSSSFSSSTESSSSSSGTKKIVTF